MNKNNERTLKEAIEEMLQEYKLKGKLNEVRLVSAWEKVMGKMIANRTTDIFISNKKLFIKLNSAPLREELSYGKSKMIDLLNKEVGEKVIEDVVIM